MLSSLLRTAVGPALSTSMTTASATTTSATTTSATTATSLLAPPRHGIPATPPPPLLCAPSRVPLRSNASRMAALDVPALQSTSCAVIASPAMATTISVPTSSQQNGRIIIGNSEAFQAKLEAIVQGGPQSLQVISDFDMTLTRFLYNGKRGASSHGIIEHSHMLEEAYHEATHNLFSTYYPMEVDPTLTQAEKIPHMVAWWESAHELLIKHRMNKKLIPEMVRGANIGFRERTNELFDLLHASNIPLLIFSAGIGNVIKEALAIKARLHPNMHVISNFMEFDAEGYTSGFAGKTIHVYNKQDVVVKDSPVHKSIADRHNVILLGDSLGDLQMSRGVDVDNILTIGFLNDKVAERLESYKQAFDVVILGDGSVDLVYNLISMIISGECDEALLHASA
ncbi:hypothetical protein CAOG_009602 [Capsaspora owczarzaki ATCC 30864]|uniref:5'-nucleotidase n=1 Tax=Capsaspora owczarzaki (strain ATCC 30864) TaxID=595528 RepID=A0A0D2U9Z3_CAPO3|nr:hypothetical protein CAOG_009602 [Capsaspora owczarzaki ATCC 30864]